MESQGRSGMVPHVTTEHFTQVDFENFGPIKKASLKLTRLHALIGPNDAGKSFTLTGIATASTMFDSRSELKRVAPNVGLAATTPTTSGRYSREKGFTTTVDGEPGTSAFDLAQRWPAGARQIHFEPAKLRQPAKLLSDNDVLDFSDAHGHGLGAVLDAIFVRNALNYLEIERGLVDRFPTIAGLRLFTYDNRRGVGVRLKDGTSLEAGPLSEGILYYLAYSALRFLHPTAVLLVEEPENGLHPARIAEVVSILREISKTTQVVMATHSPLVINELQPKEVTVVTRTPDEGTKFTPIASVPNFEDLSSVYALGELWLSYADGKTEAPLLKPTGTK